MADRPSDKPAATLAANGDRWSKHLTLDVLTTIYNHPGLTLGAKTVIMVNVVACGRHTFNSESDGQIAARCGLRRNAVVGAHKAAERLGVLTVEHRPGRPSVRSIEPLLAGGVSEGIHVPVSEGIHVGEQRGVSEGIHVPVSEGIHACIRGDTPPVSEGIHVGEQRGVSEGIHVPVSEGIHACIRGDTPPVSEGIHTQEEELRELQSAREENPAANHDDDDADACGNGIGLSTQTQQSSQTHHTVEPSTPAAQRNTRPAPPPASPRQELAPSPPARPYAPHGRDFAAPAILARLRSDVRPRRNTNPDTPPPAAPPTPPAAAQAVSRQPVDRMSRDQLRAENTKWAHTFATDPEAYPLGCQQRGRAMQVQQRLKATRKPGVGECVECGNTTNRRHNGEYFETCFGCRTPPRIGHHTL